MKKVVIIGGGTGTFTLLKGLKKYPLKLSVIVSSADDGGSTGRLRREWGVFPPGDIRQCLVGLSAANPRVLEAFSYRFSQGKLAGHVAGNILIAALEKIIGGITPAIEILSKWLKVSGEVIPATVRPTTLVAKFENGRVVIGEHNIDEPKKNPRSRIKKLVLRPASRANPRALAAVASADAIVFGPGDLYTSILPSLLPGGLTGAINKSPAKKIMVTNIMTKPGQTDGFTAADFVSELKKYLGAKIDVAALNSQRPDSRSVKQYRRASAEPVLADANKLASFGVKVVSKPIISKLKIKKSAGDILQRSLVRHDSQKLAKIIWELV
ncbi:MAG: YvcK family protein [Patescibacteria group bacterium]|nr:YvcK family protein [Patescibacteria group bacterium]